MWHGEPRWLRALRFSAVMVVAAVSLSSCFAGDGAAGNAKPSESSDTSAPTSDVTEDGNDPGFGYATSAQITLTGSPDGFLVTALSGAEVIPDETYGAQLTLSIPGGGAGPAGEDGSGGSAAGGSGEGGESDGTAGMSEVGFRLEVVAPQGSTMKLMSDQSVAVLDAQGVLIGGVSAPKGATSSGGNWRGSWSQDGLDGLALEYVGEAAAAAFPLTVTTQIGSGLVASLNWGNREGGKSLGVVPTSWGRASGQAGREFGFTEVVKAMPETDTNVMRDQFHCHFDGAIDKKQWNLEPWRPDVGYLSYILAKCNPT